MKENMMINIGKKEDGTDGLIDLNKLITTRALICANSGGGKSWLLRRLLEQSHGKIQQIIIDLEGEFTTLREKYDYLLVGQEGEIPASIKTASLLAKKLLELNVSTIIDLSELKQHERIIFVKRFLESLINLPKKLWHPCMITLDETHLFAPEKSKSECLSAVIDVATRGRKRRYPLVGATQRLSKLNKDVCAELINQFIGRTGLDIDRKRAGDNLGFNSKEKLISLRNLKPGEFYAFGPAISTEVIKIKVGKVYTSHEVSGRNITQPSKTPENIKKILKDLIDLPKEADEDMNIKQNMKNKIIELKRQIIVLEHNKPKPEAVKTKKLIQWENDFNKMKSNYLNEINLLKVKNNTLTNTENKIRDLLEINPVREMVAEKTYLEGIAVKTKIQGKKDLEIEVKSLRLGAMKILGWLAGVYPKSLTKQRLATLSGFSRKGGTFNTYLSELKRNGWIKSIHNSNLLLITDEGLNNAKDIPDIPSGNDLINMWSKRFRAGAGKLLKIICGKYPDSITKEDLGIEGDFEPTGGTFNTYLSELKRNNLIKIEGDNIIASKEFFGNGGK